MKDHLLRTYKDAVEVRRKNKRVALIKHKDDYVICIKDFKPDSPCIVEHFHGLREINIFISEESIEDIIRAYMSLKHINQIRTDINPKKEKK